MKTLLIMSVLLGGVVMLSPGCAKDGVLIEAPDGMYRKAFQQKDGRWYYVKNGRKYFLDGAPNEVNYRQEFGQDADIYMR